MATELQLNAAHIEQSCGYAARTKSGTLDELQSSDCFCRSQPQRDGTTVDTDGVDNETRILLAMAEVAFTRSQLMQLDLSKDELRDRRRILDEMRSALACRLAQAPLQEAG